jgi:DnaJ-class molecular chaperone
VRKLVECEHCQGKKQCTAAGGKSCDQCLSAAGRRRRDWATVRCSYCGGRGRIWVEVAEDEEAEETQESEPSDDE